MYDIIRENITYDLGRLYSDALIGQGTFRNAISSNSNNWMSTVKAFKTPMAKKLAALENSFGF